MKEIFIIREESHGVIGSADSRHAAIEWLIAEGWLDAGTEIYLEDKDEWFTLEKVYGEDWATMVHGVNFDMETTSISLETVDLYKGKDKHYWAAVSAEDGEDICVADTKKILLKQLIREELVDRHTEVRLPSGTLLSFIDYCVEFAPYLEDECPERLPVKLHHTIFIDQRLCSSLDN